MNLIQAAKLGFYSEVEKALQRKAPVNMTDTAGFSALHWAAMKGFDDIAELLIQKGANPNLTATKLNLSPLHMAAIADQKQVIEILLQNGANIDQKSTLDDTPLDMILKLNQSTEWATHFAYELPQLNVVNQLSKGFDAIGTLLSAGARIEENEDLSTFVSNVIFHDRADVLKAMLKRGYNYKILNNNVTQSLGFDCITLLVVSNCAVNCLQLLHQDNDKLLYPTPNSISHRLNTSLFNIISYQLPTREILTAPFEFLQIQKEKTLIRETVPQYIPACLSKHEVVWMYDNKEKRYFISRIVAGMSAIYFDAQGQVINIAELMQKLEATLIFLQKQNLDINEPEITGFRSATNLLSKPAEIIKSFVKCGLLFTGEDLHTAIKSCPTAVIKAIIESGASVTWRNCLSEDALDIIKQDGNDDILNDRPELMQMILERQLEELCLKEDDIEQALIKPNRILGQYELSKKVKLPVAKRPSNEFHSKGPVL